MAETLSKQEAKHVAELAKIRFTDAELDVIVGQLGNILTLVDTLNEVDTTDVVPTYSVTENVNMFRDDVADNWNQKTDLLNNAPQQQDDMIKVPAILDGGDN
ncbi:MAG: Asp-tRNA(Asn)/Glu-tRNA(Gln) amidotransferase subunit GatC [Lactobacillaceae bacterium]|jgi:aspartyl-tRNA(Asn)/glutamyl-tRNA(Gln) amidotransferase subunit C|nr:Asp-tRNA(Asn)/Glu-tRNA(Gln) amidotransferase subunit GatC [Lactobacillaceae bacterium]